MRSIFRIFFTVAIMLITASCGTATDVGNPSGPLPTTQVLTGQIDGSTIVMDSSAIKQYGPADGSGDGETNGVSDDLSAFRIYATSDDGMLSFSDQLDTEGNFAIEVDAGHAYTFDLRLGDIVIGQFNFKQDAQGDRGPHLNVRRIGRDIDMGVVRFENGEFVPEYEPFDEMESGDGTDGDLNEGIDSDL